MYSHLFKNENVYKSKEDLTPGAAKSLQLLRNDFGGTSNLFQTIRTDTTVSDINSRPS